jgi:hypothetical protein
MLSRSHSNKYQPSPPCKRDSPLPLIHTHHCPGWLCCPISETTRPYYSRAMVRVLLRSNHSRVNSLTGQQMFRRKRGNFAGLIIPNMLPGERHPREYRLRRDESETEITFDGRTREINKYISPPSRPNLIRRP